MGTNIRVYLVAEVGNKVSLFDEDMMQVTEWVELSLGVDFDKTTPCLYATFKSPKRMAPVTHAVVWDSKSGLMQPQTMDIPITVYPGNSIEYRINITNAPGPFPVLMRKY